MNKRTYIDKKILLQSEDGISSQTKIFHVSRKLNEGGSVICYEGSFKSGTKGTLREFYPRNMMDFLERNEQGQLIIKSGYTEQKNIFLNQRDNYLRTYNLLKETQLENTELRNFLPPFEIYFGACDEENSAKTAYIWNPEQRVETFKKICDKIHKRPEYKSETQLFIALQAIKSLTKCICALHNAELIHRDIKPSNFGFKKFNKEILPQTISIFDTDTICSVYDEPEVFAASQGYSEPEFLAESPNNLTDIFSIGATLFSAIIVSDDRTTDDCTFHDKDFDKLKYLVENSKLITSLKISSASRLKTILIEILQKTLCCRENRFQTCEELLEKIEEANFYLMPEELARKSSNGEKWVLKDAEKSFEKEKEKNISAAIQYHLFEQPLYKKMSANEKSLHILIFGFGNYGQKFLDVCLQAGQMVDINFSATIVSASSADKDDYLNYRPALKDFFDVDNDKATCGQSYGKISFTVEKIAKNETAANSDEVDNIILNLCEKSTPHYIFVAMGNDTLNKNVAAACRNALKALEINCLVTFAQDKNTHSKLSGITPIYVRQNFKTSEIHSEIERMAFNAHLVWEKNLNVDFDAVKKEFLKPYNHDACVANVLSIKYKLHSIGIDIKKINDFPIAAKIFVERKLHRDGKKNTPEYDLRNKLIFVEHKRWVVEKICNGWQQRTLAECVDGLTKDKKNYTHACILTSRPDRLLHDDYSLEDWDTMSQQEIQKLDELDKLSVELHQQFLRQVEENQTHTRILLHRALEDIETELSGKMSSYSAFSEFKVCLQEIINGDKNKIRLYKNLKAVFEKSLAELNSTSRKNIQTSLEDLENKFQPVLNSMEYRDYKQDDVALIDDIPFILTYSTKIALAIPYSTGNNTKIFCNVASATIINPAKIIYLALFEKKSDVTSFKNSLSGLFKYLNRKNLHADIEFIVALNASPAECSRLELEIKNFDHKKIQRVKISPINLKNKLATFKNYLKNKNDGKFLLLLEKNDTRLSGLLEGDKFYENFAAYEFNSLNMKFNSLNHCDFLNYINKKQFITANDLTELNSSRANFGEQPTFFEDYTTLWKKYRANTSIWKTLCSVLANHSKISDLTAELTRPSTYSNVASAKEYTYLLPQECLRTVEDSILKILKEQKFIACC